VVLVHEFRFRGGHGQGGIWGTAGSRDRAPGTVWERSPQKLTIKQTKKRQLQLGG